MGLRRVKILLEKEVREFISGRAWLIALVLPLFIALLFATVYREAEKTSFKIGYFSPGIEPGLVKLLATSGLPTIAFSNEKKALAALDNGAVDGVLLPSDSSSRYYQLLVLGADSKTASLIINSINAAIIKLYRRDRIPQLKPAYRGKTIQTRWLALPLWLIQIILTICLLQNTAGLADEKAKQTFHSIIITPVTVPEYLSAKIIWNCAIGLVSLWLTVGLTGYRVNPFYLNCFGLLGCLAYTAAGIGIGLLAPNSILARTISTLVYLVSSLPLMAKNINLAWRGILNILPTYLIFHGMENAVFRNPFKVGSLVYAGLLLAEAVFILSITIFTLKRKIDL